MRIRADAETRQLRRDLFELGPDNMKGMTYTFKIEGKIMLTKDHYGIKFICDQWPRVPRWVIYCLCEGMMNPRNHHAVTWFDLAYLWIADSYMSGIEVGTLVHQCAESV